MVQFIRVTGIEWADRVWRADRNMLKGILIDTMRGKRSMVWTGIGRIIESGGNK